MCLLTRAENRLCADFEDEQFKMGISLRAMLTRTAAADALSSLLPFPKAAPDPIIVLSFL